MLVNKLRGVVADTNSQVVASTILQMVLVVGVVVVVEETWVEGF
jgi:hypothetical protein